MIFCWARWLIEENSLINWQAGTWLYRVARPKELKIDVFRILAGATLYMMTAEKLTMPECRMELRQLSRK